ncbi:MAG: hypothetical protein Q9163_001349 [Psora crenata]
MSKSISAKATLPTKWVVESLLQIPLQPDPLAELQDMVDAILNSKKGKTLAATDITVKRLEVLFNIVFDLEWMGSRPWRLQCEEYEMPQRLQMELGVEVMDPSIKEKIRVTGRADWAFGYGSRDSAIDGTFLVAIEAKQRSLFSTAEKQLLAYLSILREIHLKAKKTNVVTQGFYTDGYRYCFMAINNYGQVESSLTYDVMTKEGGKTIFNFIVTILESAIKSSPTVTPTKAAKQRDNKVGNYNAAVWPKVYVPYLSSRQTESDGEEKDSMDLPRVEPDE